MKEILTDEMLHEMFSALERGEEWGYCDGNTSIQVGPSRISINYHSTPEVSNKDKEVARFLNFCDEIHNDLFVEVCDSFEDSELDKLQKDLDTDNYQNTIKVFTTRAREIANSRLTEICNEADAEIRHQEEIIKAAKQTIEIMHKDLDEAYTKYALPLC